MKSTLPIEVRVKLDAELSSGGLRYMLAMYWQGRKDKISDELIPMLDWVTKNCLPVSQGESFEYSPGSVSFAGQDHAALLNAAMAAASQAAAA